MIHSFVANFWREDDGQDLVEYSLLLALVSLVAISLLLTVGGSVKTLWSTSNSKLASAAS